MAYLIELSRQAEAEVMETFAWKGQTSLEGASRWYAGLREALRSLEEQPKRCPLAPENDVFSEEVRHLLYGRRSSAYRIVFVVRGVTVFVLSVRHGAQRPLSPDDWEADTDGDDEEAR